MCSRHALMQANDVSRAFNWNAYEMMLLLRDASSEDVIQAQSILGKTLANISPSHAYQSSFKFDPQQYKLYDAESCLPEGFTLARNNVVELQKDLAEYIGMEVPKALYTFDESGANRQVYDEQGVTTNILNYRYKNKFPAWYDYTDNSVVYDTPPQASTVVHEMAHAAVNHRFGKIYNIPHGPIFVRILQDLYRHHFGNKYGNAFIKACGKDDLDAQKFVDKFPDIDMGKSFGFYPILTEIKVNLPWLKTALLDLREE